MPETRAVNRTPSDRKHPGALLAVGLALASGPLGACRDAEPASGDEPSPNASILPSPLASQRPSPLADAGKPGVGELIDGGTPDAQAPVQPEYFDLDGPPPPDAPAPRDSPALTAKAAFSWVPRPPGTGASRPGLFPVEIEFASHGRMRLTLDSEFMPLPRGTEFRSRVDRYGHVLVWPGQATYRVLAPGTVRALFEERRADVGPLLDATIEERGKGRFLGVATHKEEVKNPMATLMLEQARLAGVGNAGQLLCRFLLELVLAKPDSPACLADHLPLRAEYTWENGGQLTFAVSLVTEKVEIQLGQFLTPPRRATFSHRELPPPRELLLVSESEVAAMSPDPKAKPLDSPRAKEASKAPPKNGLLLENRLDSPRFLLVNDEFIAWMPPGSKLHLKQLKAGAYSLISRDFLGVEALERWAQKVPGQHVLGAQDEAASPPGAAN